MKEVPEFAIDKAKVQAIRVNLPDGEGATLDLHLSEIGKVGSAVLEIRSRGWHSSTSVP